MRPSSQGHWEFRSADDVVLFWEHHRSVPSRADGRKPRHEERFYLGLYLLALADHELLSYPLIVEQGRQHESPDFMLSCASGEVIGLEVTRATEQSVQRQSRTVDQADAGWPAL